MSYEFLSPTERFNLRNGRQVNGEPAPPPPVESFTLLELREQYPELRPPVVDGLLRKAETVNIIAPAKFGKSWLGYGLAASIITGRPWLDTFATTPGRVLLVDNEVHKENLSHRLATVGAAMGFELDEWGWALDVWPLRGKLRSLSDLAVSIAAIEPDAYQLVLLDAKYRFAMPGVSENDNASEASFYNMIDRLAGITGASFALIHHSSKGSQADKRTTDVGAGAGAQSRAADCHLVLREHEEPNVCVLDAAVRSFAPVSPLSLRWEFPLWIPDDSDTSKLKGRVGTDPRQADRDREGTAAIVTALLEGDATAREIRRRTAMSKDRCDRLLAVLETDGHVTSKTIKVKGNECLEYHVVDDQSTT